MMTTTDPAWDTVTHLLRQAVDAPLTLDAVAVGIEAWRRVVAERDRAVERADQAEAEAARLAPFHERFEDVLEEAGRAAGYRATLEKIASGTWTSEALTVSGFARRALAANPQEADRD